MKDSNNQKNSFEKTKRRREKKMFTFFRVLTLEICILIYFFSMSPAWANEILLNSFSSDKRFQDDIYVEIKSDSIWEKASLRAMRDFLNRLAVIMICSMIPVFLALIILKYLVGEISWKTQAADQIRRDKGGYQK